MSLAQSMNLDSVMAHLAQMSPQQLQQFAAMHKDDPIMLAAASSVKNKMDKIQQSRQAQMAGQQPPKVNEQVVESMAPQGGQHAAMQLPEQQGIGALPTPNMQHMAGGGIVAFADGGYTDEQMMDDNEPVTRMAGGGIAHFDGSQGSWIDRLTYGNLTPAEKARKAALESQANEKRMAPYPETMAQERARNMQQVANQGYTRTDPRAAAAVPSATSQLTQAATNPSAQPDGEAPPADKTAPPQPRPPAPTGIASVAPQDYRAQMAGYMPKETVDPFAAQRQELNDAATNAAQMRANRLREDIAAEGKAGEAQEERIGKREGELGKQKDLNLHMSMIEAGLAMMQSHGKGLAGLAEGAGVGMKSYTSGIQRLQAAQEKIDDARDRLDELRRNETRMNNREVRAAENDIENTALSGKKDALAGMQQAYGIDKQDARTFFETAAKAEEGERNRANQRAIANAPNGQMQLLSALGGGNIQKGLETMTAIQAGKRTVEQSYEDYMKAFAGKDTTITPPLTPAQYVQQINQIRALSQVPKAGNTPTGQALP